MRLGTIVVRIGIVAAVCGATYAVTPAANAQSPTEDRGMTLLKQIVDGSNDPYLKDMSSADKKLVQTAMKKSLTVTVVTTQAKRLTSAQATSRGLTADAAAASGGCWYNEQGVQYKIMFATAAQVVQQLNWCSNGSNVTSYTMDPYYAAGRSGFSATITGPSFRNLSWEVRGLNVVTMSTFNGISTGACPQIRGGKTGQTKAYTDECAM